MTLQSVPRNRPSLTSISCKGTKDMMLATKILENTDALFLFQTKLISAQSRALSVWDTKLQVPSVDPLVFPALFPRSDAAKETCIRTENKRWVGAASLLCYRLTDLPIGCHECSKRRIHCDRTEPSCYKCTSRGLSCSGLGIRHRFNKGVAARGKWAGKTIDKVYEEWV